MKCLANRLTLTAILIAIGISTAQAQESAAAASGEWTISGNIDEAYDSDVLFSGTEGNGDWSTRLGGSLGRSWLLHRGDISLNGSATQLLYRTATSMNN